MLGGWMVLTQPFCVTKLTVTGKYSVVNEIVELYASSPTRH